MKKQFSPVDCKYGAPMGRATYGVPSKPCRLFKVHLDTGGYDDGGAYWGTPSDLYCARAEHYEAFVRALNRNDAAIKLDITQYVRKS